MSTSVSRASLLRGNLFGTKDVVRPPWALPEAEFTDICERCDDCADSCPEGIIEAGPAGFPIITFAIGECTFCGECTDVCRSGAFGPRDNAPWQVEITVTADCMSAQGVTCRVCEGKCQADAISFPVTGAQFSAAGKPAINVAACNGCGACVGPCPSEAIDLNPQPGGL
ncbi:MAG: ferredoxin-type protein NapF [Rhodospirillaceae bacterium]|nr:ferredoxin-type protein NapF [Rhodospirillaceae bacterium]